MADEIRTAEDATGGGGAGEPVVEELKAFVACVKDIRLLGFLQSFMQKTVSETCGVQALVHINEVVTLPEDDNKPNITNNFNAPVGQQVSHADYAGYPQTKEGEPYE